MSVNHPTYTVILEEAINEVLNDTGAAAVLFHGHSGYMRYVSSVGLSKPQAASYYSQISVAMHDELLMDSRTQSFILKTDQDKNTTTYQFFIAVAVINERAINIGLLIAFYSDRKISVDQATLLKQANKIAELVEESETTLGLTNKQYLEERDKIQRCLRQISSLANQEKEIISYLRQVINLVHHGFKYPRFISAEIRYGDVAIQSDEYVSTSEKLSETRTSNRGNTIEFCVSYSKKSQPDTPSFNQDERYLVSSALDFIQLFINQKELQLELIKANKLQKNVNHLTKLGTWKLEVIEGKPSLPYLDEVSLLILGYDLDERVTHDQIMELYQMDDKSFQKDLKEMLHGTTQIRELKINLENETTKWIKISGQAQSISDNHYYLWGGILDITEEKKAQQSVARKAELLSTVAMVSSILNRNQNLKDNIEEGLELGGKTIYADGMRLLQSSEDHENTFETLAYWFNPESEASFPENIRIRFSPQSSVIDKLRKGEIVQGVDIYNMGDEVKIDHSHTPANDSYTILTPILVHEKLSAILMIFFTHQIRSWKEEETNLLKNISFGISDLLQRDQYYNELQQSLADVSNSERKHRMLFEGINEGIAVIREGKFIECNPYLANLLGCSVEEIIGQPPIAFSPTHQLDGKKSEEEMIKILDEVRDSKQVEFQWLMETRQDTRFLVQIKLTKTEYDGEKALFAIVRDLSEINEAQRTILKLSKAVEQSPIMVIITDTQGNIEYANDSVSEITGYSHEELIGQNPRILQSGKTPAHQYKDLWDSLKQGQQWKGEFLNKKKNGELYWESDFISPVTDDHGNTLNFIAVKEDITKKKATEKALRESQERFQQIAIVNQSVIWETNAKGRYIYLSPGVKEVLGYDPAELIDGQLSDILNREHHYISEGLISKLSRTDLVMDSVHSITHKRGHIIWLKTNALVIYGKDGSIKGFRGTHFDISKELNAQQHTLNAVISTEQKERKRIAESLHDDLQQSLLAAQLHIGTITKHLENLDIQAISRFATGFKLLKESVNRTRTISHELRPPSITELGLKQAILTNISKFDEDIEFNYRFQVDESELTDETKLIIYRITQEMINNIVKHSKAKKAAISLEKSGNHQICIHISDDGVGIDLDQLEAHMGEGIGLNSIEANVKSLGGTMNIDSIRGNGSDIQIVLPVLS